MSDGNYGGNGSVWWQVEHKVGTNGPKQKLKKRNAGGTDPKKDHWLDETDGTTTIGHDPVNTSSIGEGMTARFNVHLRLSAAPFGMEAGVPLPGTLSAAALDAKVNQLRGDITAELTRLKQQVDLALQSMSSGTPPLEVFLDVNVPAIFRSNPPAGPPGDRWEVNVHW